MFHASGQQNLRIADLVPKAHGNFMYDLMSAHFSLGVYLKALISPRLFAHARVCFGRVSLTIACHVVEPLVLEKWASRVCWLTAGCSICILCFSYKSFWYRVWVVFVLSLKLGYVSVIWLWFSWTRAFKNIKIPENFRFPIDFHTFSDIFETFVPTDHYFVNSQIIFPQLHPRVSILWSWYSHKRTFVAAR